MKKYITLLLVAFLFACSDGTNDSASENAPADGQGGSLATFTLKGDYLYVVDQQNLSVFSVQETDNPIQVNTVPIGFDIETLFGYKDYLYIGSQTGMFIYGLSNPEFPEKLSSVQHFTACDPVVANDTHAFVTLHSNTFCGNNINLLEIYDVTDVTSPILISSRNLTYPKGLGLYGNYLFVCDDEIKIFDVSDPTQSKLVNAINKEVFDVIIRGDLLIAIGNNGLFQYQLSAADNNLNYNPLSTINF